MGATTGKTSVTVLKAEETTSAPKEVKIKFKPLDQSFSDPLAVLVSHQNKLRKSGYSIEPKLRL